MKMRSCLFVFLLSFLFYGHTQSDVKKTDDIKVMYQFDYKKYVNSEKLISESTALIINDEKGAIFTYQKMINLDSIKRIKELDMVDAMSNRLSTYSFISRRNDSIIHHEVIGNDLLKFKESLSLNWKLISEEKLISGYKCKKAVLKYAGRNWVAWFTSDIPVNHGPYKFYGLPGLIIELYDSEKLFSFKAYEIRYGDFHISDSIENYFLTENGETFQEVKRNDFLMVRSKFYQMSLNEKLKFMNRNEEGNYNLVATSTSGESINTNRKPKIRNFIERYQKEE